MIIVNDKIVVFCDEGLAEWQGSFNPLFLRKEIHLENVEVYSTPIAFSKPFDIFMFDWGGMSHGNDVMDHYIRRLYKMAEDHPSKEFVLLSLMTNASYRDFIDYSDQSLLPNIFSFRDFTAKLRRDYECY